jgi:hypothetical protein
MPRASRERNAMYSAGLSPRDPPTPKIVRQLAEEDARQESQWNDLKQVVDFLRLAPDERFRRTGRPSAT